MAGEIEACPFCASANVRVVNASRGWRTVRCYDCFARGPSAQSEANPLEDSELIAAWNRRASRPESGAGALDRILAWAEACATDGNDYSDVDAARAELERLREIERKAGA